jgi:hypothetical protein
VGDRWAVVVGIEQYLHPELGGVPFAEADAAAVSAALASAGCPADRQIVLRGPHATRAAVEARLKRLRKQIKKGEAVVVFWSGRGFTAGGQSRLACWDTLPDDVPETSVAFADLFIAIDGSKAGQVVFLLSVGSGPAVGPHTPHLDEAELEAAFTESPKAVGLSACRPVEESHAAAAVKHGLWAQLVAEALSGQARTAADKAGKVTAPSLQRYIEDELPRRLRKHFEAGVTQTPILYGQQNAATVLAALSAAASGDAVLDPARLRRVVFRSETTTRVKDLTDFRKTYQLPTNAGPSARKFIARVAAPDVRADLDRVYESAREALGYKRKDLELAVGNDGYGTLRTPDFEYTVYVDLDRDDPTRLTWRREAGRFADPGFVRGPHFGAVFGRAFDQLVFEFSRPADVAAFVDRIEDDPPPGVKVSAASDGKSADVSIAGFAGVVTLRRHALTVRGRSAEAAGLLDLFLRFLHTFGSPGDPPALGPKPAH